MAPPESNSPFALRVSDLGKSFLVPPAPEGEDPRRERAGRRHDRFHALRGIDFTIRPGQTLGLIGPNGSGKSTLLKILSGVMQPDSGHFEANGRVGALLELGAGFHPELSGVQNVFLTGALLGCSHAEISRLLPEIIGFSELERTIDLPVKHFSSGMVGRLGFSVAAHLAPEILLMDETFATGDAGFQTKALARIALLKAQGRTMILVSHNMYMLLHMADCVLWIDKGQIRRFGPPREVMAEYGRSQQANLYQAFEARNHLGLESLFEVADGVQPAVQIAAARLQSGGNTAQAGAPVAIAMHAPVRLEVALRRTPAFDPGCQVFLHAAWVSHDDRILAESRTAVTCLDDKPLILDYPRFELTEGEWRLALGISVIPAGGVSPPRYHDRKLDTGAVRVTTPNPLHLPAALDLACRWSTE